MMRPISLGRAAAVAFLLLSMSTFPGARAQDRRPGPGPGGPMGAGPRDEGPDADDLDETVQIYMLARMKKSLSLTRDQEEKIVPLIQDLSDVRRRHFRERRLDMMRLRPLVEDSSSSEEEIGRILAHMDEGEKAFRSAEARSLDQVKTVLHPRQQAQFIFFQERFRNEMQERFRRFRGGGPDGAPRGGGRPPADDQPPDGD